ncbi:hypothetical protein K435DRAFT_194256 [Dendrothele bispora CBS 962.96]|uniref:Uncharacterized protein n=1 Tax=Dendrothele bispora (strain CBS 962.96) TaxID=1314807 RepID=A0A4S8LW44_DENBC|nr:hypothetical protein K435DRAFT_194256 [Dendrothele bispora CBS 962.96]
MPAPTSKPFSSKLPGKKLFPTPNTNVRSSSDSDIHVVGGRIAPRPSRLSSSKIPTSSSKPHSRPKGPQVGDEVIVLSDEENDVDAGMGTEKDGEPGFSGSVSTLPPRRRGSVVNVKKEKQTPNVKTDGRVGSDVIVISDSDSEGVPLARDTGRGKSSKGKEKARSPSSPHPRPRSYSDFWGSLSRGDSEQVGGPAVGPETDEERSIPDEDRNGAEERKGKEREKERAIGSVDPNVDESRQETPTSLRSGPEKGQRLSEVPESPPPTENEVVEDTSVDETNVPDDLPEEVGGDTEDMDVHMEVDIEQSVPGPEELRAPSHSGAELRTPSDSGAEPKEEQTQTNGIDVRVDMVTDSPPGAETGEEQPQTDSIDVGVHMVTNPLLEAAGLDSSLPESPQPVLDRSSQENLSISSPIKELPTRKPKTSSSLPLSYEQQMAQAYASLSQPSDDTGSKRTSSTGVGASASPTLSSSLSTPTLRSSATPSTVPTKMGPSRSSSIISGSGSASSSTRSSNRARKSTGKSGLPIYKIPIKNDPAADTSPSTSASADTSEIGVGRNNPLNPRPSSSNSHAKASVRGSRYARSPLGPQKSAQDKLDQDHEEVDVSATRRRSTSSQATALEQSGTADLIPPPSRRSSSSSIRSGETSASVPRPASAQNKPQSLTDIYNRLEDAYNADATNVQSLTANLVRKLNVSSEGDTPPPIPVPAKNKSRPSAGAIQRLALVRELMKSSSKGKGNVQVQAAPEPDRDGEKDNAKAKETAESDAMAVGQSVADEDHQMSTEKVATSLQLGSELMDQSEPAPDESSVQSLDRRLRSEKPSSLSAVQEQVQELASTSVSISGWIDEPLEYADSPSPMDQDEVNEEERVSAELMCHSSGTSDSTISPVDPVVTHQIINTSSSTAIHTELVVDAPLPQVGFVPAIIENFTE